jgi:hypothetical protein
MALSSPPAAPAVPWGAVVTTPAWFRHDAGTGYGDDISPAIDLPAGYQ